MASETVKCCREWAVLPCWGNPQSVGLQHDDAPVVRIGPGEQCHCPDCGARFTLRETGEVQVGPSVAKLLAALHNAIAQLRRDRPDEDCLIVWTECPFDAELDALCDADGGCPALGTPAADACWLGKWGLATTYADAQALWARMEEAAK